MATLTGIVKSLSVTTKGGTALALTGVKTASYTKNRNLSEDRDPANDVPNHYWTGTSESLTVSLRDRALAIALLDQPCVTSLTCIIAKPRTACDVAAYANSVTITGTNLVAEGDVEGAAGSADGVPGEYSVTFKATTIAGVAGSFTVVAAV